MCHESKRSQSLPATLFVVACSIVGISGASAQQQGVSPLGDAAEPNCQAVYAVASTRKIVDCPPGKGYTFCFTREVRDQANIISGQLAYFSGPMKSIPHPYDPDTSVIAAPETITTADGVLELEEHGLFNTKSLEFAGIETVTGGTGKFAGYSGKLMGIGYAKGKAVFMGTLCRD